MTGEKVERFLSSPACRAVPGTAELARDFCYRLPKMPTPRMKLMDDGAIRLRWLRGPREVKVYIRGEDVNFSIHSRTPGDVVPPAVVKAATVTKAMKIGLRWVAKAEGAGGV